MFYDLNDNTITNFRFSIESEDIKTMSLKIDCVNGKTLKSSSSGNLTIEAKHEDDLVWINLETTGIDLSEWAGDREIFDVRITALEALTYILDNFYLYLQ